MKQSRAVGNRRAPVVADDDCAFRAQRRDQTADVSAHVLDRVGLDCERFVAAAIAAHVRRSNSIAGVC
jgi:hypothetical protein